MANVHFGGYGVAPRVRRLAELICIGAFGDWEATGYGIKLSCIGAADAALLHLDQQGWDHTLLDAEDVLPPTGTASSS